MDDKVTALFSELSQICEQYKREVPGGRRAWPKSIKDRVFALQRLGISAHQVAKQVPIPYMTIVSWNAAERKKGKFLPVKVVKGEPTTVTVASRARRDQKHRGPAPVTTVTVVTPTGFRIEGLPATEAMAWLMRESQ